MITVVKCRQTGLFAMIGCKFSARVVDSNVDTEGPQDLILQIQHFCFGRDRVKQGALKVTLSKAANTSVTPVCVTFCIAALLLPQMVNTPCA